MMADIKKMWSKRAERPKVGPEVAHWNNFHLHTKVRLENLNVNETIHHRVACFQYSFSNNCENHLNLKFGITGTLTLQ